jgi:hypothetical protein
MLIVSFYLGKQRTGSSHGLSFLLINKKIRLCGKNTPCEPLCFVIMLFCFIYECPLYIHYG